MGVELLALRDVRATLASAATPEIRTSQIRRQTGATVTRSEACWLAIGRSVLPRTLESIMIHRPPGLASFEFVVIAALRAAQLVRGCTPRVPASEKPVVTAQREVAELKCRAAPRAI